MPAFTVRVQLDGKPTRAKYQELHVQMLDLGLWPVAFGVTAVGEPTALDMPVGTFYGTVRTDVYTLRDEVVRLALEINPAGCQVFVAETATWAQRGYSRTS